MTIDCGPTSSIMRKRHKYCFLRNPDDTINANIVTDCEIGCIQVGDMVTVAQAYSDLKNGAMCYEVVAAGTGIHNNGQYIDVCEFQFYAKQDQSGPIDVVAWGARPNVLAGVEEQINNAIADNQGGWITVPPADEPYYINAEGTVAQPIFSTGGGVKMLSDTKLEILSGAVLEASPQDFTHYAVVRFPENTVNATVEGDGIIRGDVDTYTGSNPSEQGHCVTFQGTENCTIRNVTMEKARGDGIFVGYSLGNIDVLIDTVKIRDCRRQGISATNVNGLRILDVHIRGIGGTSPQSGIDLEPESGYLVSDVTIENPDIADCVGAGIVTTNVLAIVINVRITGGILHRNATGLSLNGVTNINVDGTDLIDNTHGFKAPLSSSTGRIKLGVVTGNELNGILISQNSDGLCFDGGEVYGNGTWGLNADRAENLDIRRINFGGNGPHPTFGGGNVNLFQCNNTEIKWCDFSNKKSDTIGTMHINYDTSTDVKRFWNTLDGSAGTNRGSNDSVHDIENSALVSNV